MYYNNTFKRQKYYIAYLFILFIEQCMGCSYALKRSTSYV
jgi:hypothetical protein